jgi:hypothetical protein
MKFMLMMNTPTGGAYQVGNWPPQDLKAHIGFMKTFAKKLTDSGELVAAEGLAGPDQAKSVRAGRDGKPVTDGVFPESKEFLAGYWIVDVETPERAYQIAAEASAAPGPRGEPLHLAIEVRQIIGGGEIAEAPQHCAQHLRRQSAQQVLVGHRGSSEGSVLPQAGVDRGDEILGRAPR